MNTIKLKVGYTVRALLAPNGFEKVVEHIFTVYRNIMEFQ